VTVARFPIFAGWRLPCRNGMVANCAHSLCAASLRFSYRARSSAQARPPMAAVGSLDRVELSHGSVDVIDEKVRQALPTVTGIAARFSADRAKEHLNARPKRYRSGRAGRHTGNATRLVRKGRPDSNPFNIPHDSKLRFGRLNHAKAMPSTGKTRQPVFPRLPPKPDMPETC
jgi:hypothetical protein